MNEMIERVAKAVAAERFGIKPDLLYWEQESDAWRESHLSLARAAIEAMREPTEAMVLAARNTYYDIDAQTFSDAEKNNPDRHVLRMAKNDYQAMIDEALKDEHRPAPASAPPPCAADPAIGPGASPSDERHLRRICTIPTA